MLDIKNSISIPKDVSTKNDLDYQFLKQKGIEYIESMGGGLWTDYNEHDPGVTMLEMLAYAITDLGNRINLPMQDLLSSKNSTNFGGQFYQAADILSSRAVTALDYRKIFLDIPKVRNCWILPYQRTVYVNCKDSKLSYNPDAFSALPPELKSQFNMKGLNKILVDYDLDINLTPIERAEEIIEVNKEIKAKYHENRNLCEDLVEINEVEKHEVCVCAEIELENNADEDEVHARVLFAIENYFSPSVHFYSLKQMMERGYRIDQIFDGPFLENGFIDSTELMKANLRSEVRLSDLMKIIMAVPGVKIIRDITIGNCDGGEQNEWIICIDSGKRPVMCDNSTFSYRKDVIPVRYNEIRVNEIFNQLVEEENAYNELARIDREPKLPNGEYLETGFYTTIQNDFPDTYGIGQAGFSSSVTDSRKAQAKQLKGYLLFFDQVLASYFAQLEKVKDLLSVQNDETRTYFTQAVKDISGLSELVQNYPMNDNDQLSENLMEALDDSIERRNELLDHLLARFAEKFSEYSFLMKELYGSIASEMVLYSKKVFLKEYVELSSTRGKSFNYYLQPQSDLWNTSNVSGAEKRIARLMGMKNYNRRNLADTNVVEIYEFNPTPGVTTYKWKVKNNDGNIILWSVREYASVEDAAEEMYKAILLLIETSEDEVEDVFDHQTVTAGTIIGNTEVFIISTSGNYFFQVIDPNIPVGNPSRIIARQSLYRSTTALLKELMLSTIRYCKYDFTDEGYYLVEHTLLRPDVTTDNAPEEQFLPICADDCKSCCSTDPYSYKVSIVLPGFTQRFSNLDFRVFMEEVIQEELPAHVIAKICWVGSRKNSVPDANNELYIFQEAYREYLFDKTIIEDQSQNTASLSALIDIMINLNTVYPVGRLYDCDDEVNLNKIILGRARLGTLEE